MIWTTEAFQTCERGKKSLSALKWEQQRRRDDRERNGLPSAPMFAPSAGNCSSLFLTPLFLKLLFFFITACLLSLAVARPTARVVLWILQRTKKINK